MNTINEELRLFVRDVTLFLQKHTNYNPEKIEPMFQRAYKLYVKYDVENQPVDAAGGAICGVCHKPMPGNVCLYCGNQWRSEPPGSSPPRWRKLCQMQN